MEIGIGIDASLGLSFAQQRELVREAAQLGYTNAWTPSGSATRDGFQVCAQWHGWTADVVPGGLTTGIAVIPAPLWTVPSLVHQAGTLADLSGGRFILGVGTGGSYSAEFRRTYGIPEYPAVALMRDYLVTLRRLFAGETVSYEGKAVRLNGLQLTPRPLNIPLYLAALGPQMLRLAGAHADGVSLNWCNPEQRAWCRDQIAAGAAAAGRTAGDVQLMEYIRVCVDDDVEVARRGLARAVMGYALARAGASNAHGYRAHFSRMGFDDTLKAIEAKRDAGASVDELADAFPTEMLQQIGAFGRPAAAAEGFLRVAAGLDTAVVRIVAARPGIEPARAVLRACAPARVATG
jgi:alkanesulfonate monooxygenase SsuD/methylene tetrahydromethanopterin reductase-like flavin-dependent oxidoreductase (luciferase family)